jgi:hypothetical protein
MALWKRGPVSLEERALEVEEFERAHRAAVYRLWLRYSPEYLMWFLLGLALMFLAFYTTDTRYAGMAFWGGIGVGDAGMLFTLIRARRDAEKCGLT